MYRYIYIYEILFPDGQIFQKFIFFFLNLKELQS